tara:strand:+ start:5004 stop:5417 length:414 start_codon:yes stop_codon:yes gene_type:complete
LNQLQGVDADTTEVLAAARVILAAATKDGVDFNVATIADTCGMAVEQVQAICASPPYQNALRSQFLAVASHALTNGARQMDKIVQGDDYSASAKVAAYRALVETIKAFDQSGGKPPEKPPEAGEFESWLANQKKKNR